MTVFGLVIKDDPSAVDQANLISSILNILINYSSRILLFPMILQFVFLAYAAETRILEFLRKFASKNAKEGQESMNSSIPEEDSERDEKVDIYLKGDFDWHGSDSSKEDSFIMQKYLLIDNYSLRRFF